MIKKFVSLLSDQAEPTSAGNVVSLLETTPQILSATPEFALPGAMERKSNSCVARNVRAEVHNLEELFFDLVSKAENGLEKANVPLLSLKSCISRLPVSLRHQHVKFLAGSLSAINDAKNVREIFSILDLYWDFLNCNLLEVIVNRLGDTSTKDALEAYLRRLKEFRCNTTVRDFIDQWTHGWPPYFADMTIEVKEEWMDRTLEDLDQLIQEVSCQYSFQSYALLLKKKAMGSLILTLALQHTFPTKYLISQTSPEFLHRNGIYHISFKGAHMHLVKVCLLF